MKFSLLGLCAIAIMMTFGFTMVAPFMHTADADSYSATLYEVEEVVCDDCGAVWVYEVVNELSVTVFHGTEESHVYSFYTVVGSVTSATCVYCVLYDAMTSSS